MRTKFVGVFLPVLALLAALGMPLAAPTLLFGAYASAFGTLLLGLSLRLRRWRAVDPRPSLNAFARATTSDTGRSARWRA